MKPYRVRFEDAELDLVVHALDVIDAAKRAIDLTDNRDIVAVVEDFDFDDEGTFTYNEADFEDAEEANEEDVEEVEYDDLAEYN